LVAFTGLGIAILASVRTEVFFPAQIESK
jgi:hypothetical protein